MLHFDAVPAAVNHLLGRLAPLRALDPFFLAGGTSLALRYGHRISVDQDFFTTDAFEPEVLQTELRTPDATVVARTGGSLTLDIQGTKLDFLRRAYPLVQKPETFGKIRMLSVPGVTAMKLNAIVNRGSKKDFFDLCELLKRHPLGEMLGFFEAKYRNSDRFIVLRSLAWFEDAEIEPDPVSLTGLTWTDAKKTVEAALRTV